MRDSHLAPPVCRIPILRRCGKGFPATWMREGILAPAAVRDRLVSTGGQAASGTRRTAEGGCAKLLSTDCYGHESRTVKNLRRLLSSFGQPGSMRCRSMVWTWPSKNAASIPPGWTLVVGDPRLAHFVTYSCFRRLPLLSRDRSRRWVIEALEDTRRRLNSPDSTGDSLILLFFFPFSFFLGTKLGLFLVFLFAFVPFALITHIHLSLLENDLRRNVAPKTRLRKTRARENQAQRLSARSARCGARVAWAGLPKADSPVLNMLPTRVDLRSAHGTRPVEAGHAVWDALAESGGPSRDRAYAGCSGLAA